MRSVDRHPAGRWLALALVAFGLSTLPARAQTDGPAAQLDEPRGAPASRAEERSPWLLLPVLNSNPKLGTSVGAMAGYVHYFDERSRPSIFAIAGIRSNTDSTIAGMMARTSFDEDNQRLIGGMVYGYVRNDYSDYLGTGVPLQSDGELQAVIARYLYRVKGDWFIGAQGLHQNFMVNGAGDFDDFVLESLGVEPYESGGLGVVVYHDSRDNENMPTEGWVLSPSNIAYRQSLGSEDDFDVYRIDFRYFRSHGEGNVFAVRQLNHLTRNAPTVARAPVQLRSYKIGQYNADYMSSIEGEERFRLAERWTATAFAGVACLYGDGGGSCADGDNLYANVGAGVQYVLKPKEGIVLNLEAAVGREGNRGVYLKMGYGF